MMKIVECLWKEQFIEKLERKHNVSTDEVEEVFRNVPRYDFITKGVSLEKMSIGRSDRLRPDGI